MSKILSSWSGMRKYLEKDMLASSLENRVRYNCTSYKGMDGCKVFELFIDNKLVKRFSWETLNGFFIENGYKLNGKPYGTSEYWEGFHRLCSSVPACDRTEYTDEEFCEALKAYRNQSIEESFASDNVLVKMFAFLDRRTGKRTLQKISSDMHSQPEWLQSIYDLRCRAENVE